MNWNTFRRWFEDDGATREIVVAPLSAADRTRLLDTLPGWGHTITPPQPGEPHPHFMVGSADVAVADLHGNELVLSFPPRPLWYDEAGYLAVEALIARIAHVLGLPVRLAVGDGTREPIADYDPMTGEFVRHEPRHLV